MKPVITIKEKKILSDQYYHLYQYHFEYSRPGVKIQEQKREVFDRGNGAAVLLYNQEKQTVILTRQFRMPTYVNTNETGMMIEVCAGMLDEDDPEAAIIREIEEETGYRLAEVKEVFQGYSSPGAVSEVLHYFVGQYDESMKVNQGGGLEEEGEDIEILEIPFRQALQMISDGEIIDAKTISLLYYAGTYRLMDL